MKKPIGLGNMARLERQKPRKQVRKDTAVWDRKQAEREDFNFSRVENQGSDLYAGIDPRRRQEVADSGMVQEDHTQIANLSSRPIHTEYKRFGFYSTPYIDDTVRE
jgi:hypothetical protein